MARLMDRNANVMAHDYASAPYYMSAVYVAYSTGPGGTQLKVGAAEVQSRDVAEVLRGVLRRVRLAVTCVGPRRKPVRPDTFVWVILALTPVLRHELEQALVEQFGNREFDPMGTRRREFCAPSSFGGIMATVDRWREAYPDVLSEALYSEDGGRSYIAPRELLPYARQTEGLWVESRAGQGAHVGLHRRWVPTWTRRAAPRGLAARRELETHVLMAGHHSGRVARFARALQESPALASERGDAYQVTLEGHQAS